MYIYTCINKYNYHRLIKPILCFICSDLREPHIRPSNDRVIKLQTLGKISLSGLRIIFNFSIKVITKLPNSEQSYKGKVKTLNYINRQIQSTTGKLSKP